MKKKLNPIETRKSVPIIVDLCIKSKYNEAKPSGINIEPANLLSILVIDVRLSSMPKINKDKTVKNLPVAKKIINIKRLTIKWDTARHCLSLSLRII